MLSALPPVGELDPDRLRSFFAGLSGSVLAEALAAQPEAWPSPQYAGVLDLWFERAADAEQAARADISSCLPGAKVGLSLLGMERVVMRLPEFFAGQAIKGVYLFRGRPDASLSAFRDYWWRVHGPIAARTQDALAYVQSHLLSTRDYHGVTEIYWRSEDEARAAITSKQMVTEQAGDAANFVDAESIVPFLARQQIIIQP